MTVLSAAQSASVAIVGRRIASLYSPSNAQDDTLAVQLAELANEVAQDIIDKHDWQALTKVTDFMGDGSTGAFPLPTDYDRMLLDSDVYDPSAWAWGYHHISSINQWMQREREPWISPGGWIILQNQMNFWPVPSANAVARFAYISSNYARNADGQEKAKFDSDTDTFAIDERLLKLGLIWRYRALKRLEYAEDMENYEIALSEAMSRDKGARAIRTPRRFPGNWSRPWPWVLG